MRYKMIDIRNCGEGATKEEVQILLKFLKPGMKLPLLNDYGCTCRYLGQLIAEHYLNGLLEGYMLKFMTTRLVKYLEVVPYLLPIALIRAAWWKRLPVFMTKNFASKLR